MSHSSEQRGPDKACFIRLPVGTGSTEVNLEPDRSSALSLGRNEQSFHSRVARYQTFDWNWIKSKFLSTCDPFRLPKAAWLHRDDQCQLPQWSRDGRHHEPHAGTRWWGSVWQHPARQIGPRADGYSALRSWDGLKHRQHASAGGIRDVSPSGHGQKRRWPFHAPRTHKLDTQQVGVCGLGLHQCLSES